VVASNCVNNSAIY
jgi:sporulation protein YlmC with PRC-barrel domain